MGMCSKSCCGLSLGNVSLTAGQECMKHGARARLCPRNLQPSTGKLGARTSARRKGSVSATGRKRRAINTVAEAKWLVEDIGKQGVTGQERTGWRRVSLQDSKRRQGQTMRRKISCNSIFSTIHFGLGHVPTVLRPTRLSPRREWCTRRALYCCRHSRASL